MPRKINEFNIIVHGVSNPDYFQGHGIALTKWLDCATGSGNTELEALEDALESLAQGDWDVTDLETRGDWSSQRNELSATVPDEIRRTVELGQDWLSAWVYVSIDVK